SDGFDEPILRAARAQAQLEHDGNVGQVIEVTGSVRPMGLEPARIDTHAKPSAPPERRRPRWMIRAALSGSVAAAAALAVVVGTSLQAPRQPASRAEKYEIQVKPAPLPQAESEALRDAERGLKVDLPQPASPPAVPAPQTTARNDVAREKKAAPPA